MTWRPRFSLRTLVVFLLLVTSGVGLWMHWEPWAIAWQQDFDGCVYSIELTSAGEEVRVVGNPILYPEHEFPPSFPGVTQLRRYYRIRDGARVGKEDVTYTPEQKDDYIRSFPKPPPTSCTSPDGRRTIARASVTMATGRTLKVGKITVTDAKTGEVLTEIEDGGSARGPFTCLLIDNGRCLVAHAADGVVCFRRRRPEWWWGVFWLWEFWLTAVFAGLFVWSVVRDRRALLKKSCSESGPRGT